MIPLSKQEKRQMEDAYGRTLGAFRQPSRPLKVSSAESLPVQLGQATEIPYYMTYLKPAEYEEYLKKKAEAEEETVTPINGQAPPKRWYENPIVWILGGVGLVILTELSRK